jgi:hypothetical protein
MQIVVMTPPPVHAPSVFFKALWRRAAFSAAPDRKSLRFKLTPATSAVKIESLLF